MASFLYGLGAGREVWTLRRAEKIVGVGGGETLLACWFQILLAIRLADLLPRALSQISMAPIRLSNGARFALLLVPVTAAGLVELARRREKKGRLCAWANPLHLHLGKAIIGLLALSYVLTLRLTPWQSSGRLSAIAVSQWLDYSHDSGDRLRRAVRVGFIALVAVRGWLGVSRMEKIISSVQILVEGLELLPERNTQRNSLISAVREELPKAPDVSIETLRGSFEKLTWCQTDKERVSQDVRFCQDYSHKDEEEYVRQGLERYVKGVRMQPFRVQTLARLLAAKVQSTPSQHRNLLIDLGLAGWKSEVEWHSTSERLHFGGDLAYGAAILRADIFRGVIRKAKSSWRRSPILSDPQRLHDWNSIVVAFPELELPGQSVAWGDPMANTSRLGREWTRWQYSDLLRSFWRKYTSEHSNENLGNYYDL